MTKHATRNLSLVPRSAFRVPRRRPLVRSLLAWFAANARDLPWRRTRDPYAIWVSEIMLQQTQVATVIPYWERWTRELPTLEAVAKAQPATLHKLWEGLGYYTRVRNLQAAARQIVKKHHGQFPRAFPDILALPGVGRYTAGAIASIAFNLPKPILDGNVMRVLTRLCAIRANPRERKTNARLWQLAAELVSCASGITHHKSPCSALNQSLMELGAIICKPRNPRCDVCPLERLCVGQRRGIAKQLPNNGDRVRSEARYIAAFIVRRRGHVLARQRPAGVVNAHFWELPHVELRGPRQDLFRCAREALGITPATPKPLFVISHNMTRYRIRVEVFAGKLVGPMAEARWLTPAELQSKAFAGMDRKILCRLQSS